MAKRPRSHQLEDLSRNRFRELIPLHWVVRERSHDYGVDFEVEVFSPEGESTGLIFLAQLKATDSAEAADRLSMPNEKLAYFAELDLPVALFRYASADDSWRWSWIFDANVINARGKAKSSTIRFGTKHVWGEQSLTELERTLRIARILRNAGPRQRIALVRAGPIGPIRQQFAIDDAITSIIGEVPCVVREPEAVDGLTLEISGDAAHLRLRIDRFASIGLSYPATGDLHAELLYCVVAMLRGVRLHSQAEAAALAVLRGGLTIEERPLAARAVAALASDPDAACDLAIRNGLHVGHDPAWVMTYHQLITARTVGEKRNRAIQRFGAEALAHAREAGDQGVEAIVHNNIANSYLGVRGDECQALRHLNAARRLRPAYMRSDYFLVDLGRALFGAKRYRAAAVFYRVAYDLQPRRGVRAFLADALMFAGLVGEAATHFRELQHDIVPDEASELGLKAMLCESMEAQFGSPVVRARTGAGYDRIGQLVGGELQDPVVLRGVTVSFDAFNLSANFDLALHSMRAGDYADAVAHFLICAFKRSGDVEAWRNAILMAANLKDALIAAAVVDCAMRMGGPTVRDAVRAELLAQDYDDRVVEAIDLTMTTALDLIRQADRGVLYRMLEIDSADPMLTFSLS